MNKRVTSLLMKGVLSLSSFAGAGFISIVYPKQVNAEIVSTSPQSNLKTAQIPLAGMEVQAGNESTKEPANNAIDGNIETIWNTDWNTSPREDHFITLDMKKIYDITTINATPRANADTFYGNGVITKYEIQTSLDNSTFTTIARGNWEKSSGVKVATIVTAVPARYVRLRSLKSYSNIDGSEYTSLAELGIEGGEHTLAVDKTLAIGKTFEEKIAKGDYTDASYDAYLASITALKEVISDATATTEQVSAAVEGYVTAKENLTDTPPVVEHGTKEELKVQIDQVDMITPESYTEESYLALQEVLKEATFLYAEEGATSQQIAQVFERLAQAINNLVDRPYHLSF